MMCKLFTTLTLCALMGAPAAADLLKGQVVDANGVGVFGVDIDVKNLGSGGTPPIFNDGTDPNGFFCTTVPAGVYRVTFKPPPPPVSTSLVSEIEPVTIIGVTNMGVIRLAPGVSLEGRCVDSAGLPVAGVNLDVIEESSGDNLTIPNDQTDAFGNFVIAVPAGNIELRFDTTTVLGGTFAPRSMKLSPAANTVLGDVTLAPGFILTGRVLQAGLPPLPLEGVDLDVFDSATGSKLYTPGDNTDVFGNFSVIVPAGLWDVEVCPPASLGLVATDVEKLIVATNLPLGSFVLQPGVLLFGTVRDAAGQPVAGADVDVAFSATGASVVLCADNTDKSGTYSVVVPTGTFDVTFSPPNFSVPLGSSTQTGVVISGNTLLDGTLPPCLPASNYGSGLAGSGGIVPHLTSAGGAPREGNGAWGFQLQGGLGGSVAVLLGATSPLTFPLFGGTGLVNILGPFTLITAPLSGPAGVPGAGTAFVPLPVSNLAGASVFAQFGVLDPAAPRGVSLSEGLQVTFCP